MCAMTKQFARRVMDVYITGALRVADELKITQFYMVVPGKDLTNATDAMTSFKWRYKKLADGGVYIASQAMQELVVSHGIRESLPWVQSVSNPRLKASFINGRILADVGRRNLTQSGDVESNPGPFPSSLGRFYVSIHGSDMSGNVQFEASMSRTNFVAPVVTFEAARYKRLKARPMMVGSFVVNVDADAVANMPFGTLCNNLYQSTGIENCRHKSAVIETLLLQSGDVEQNPGPFSATYVMNSTMDHSDFIRQENHWYPQDHDGFSEEFNQSLYDMLLWLVLSAKLMLAEMITVSKSVAMEMFEFCFGSTLDNWALECHMTKLWRDWIRYTYEHPVKAWFLTKMYPLHHITYGDARSGWTCNFVLKYRPMVQHDMFDFRSAVIHFEEMFTRIVYGCWVVGCFFTSGVITVCFVLRKLAHRRLKVLNYVEAFRHTQLKDLFREFVLECVQPSHIAGSHNILAWERRAAESFCFDQLLDKFRRVRDVGGSRSRWSELGFAKHVCGPVLGNDDIIRQAKCTNVFENCGKQGEYCPYLKKIPAAVLSHVDYHLTQNQLVQIVVGPTFIINHNFDVHKTGVGKYQDNGASAYEAKVQISGGLVTMEPDGGTPYREHAYHHWESEGSVVTRNGAFTYIRLGSLGSTTVYYCNPSAGVYDMDSNLNLSTSSGDYLPIVQGCKVKRNDVATVNGVEIPSHYSFERPNHVTTTVEAAIIDEAALTMASATRDAKYMDTMRSYLTGKLRAKQVNLGEIVMYMQLVSFLSDKWGVEVVPFTSALYGHPASFTWFDIAINNVRRVFWHALQYTWLRQKLGNVAARYAPWSFPVVRVPGYECYSEQMSSKMGGGLRTKFNKQLFRAPPAPTNASVAQQVVAGALQVNNQCTNCTGNAGAQPCAQTPPIVSNSQQAGNVTTLPSSANAQPPRSRSPSIVKTTQLPSVTTNTVTQVGRACSRSPVNVQTGNQPNNANSPSPNTNSKSGKIAVLPLNGYKTEVTSIDKGSITFTIANSKGETYDWRFTGTYAQFWQDLAARNELDGVIDEINGEWLTKHNDYGSNFEIPDWMLRYMAQPQGKFSDKSVVPKGSRIFPSVGPEAATPEFDTFTIAGVGFKVFHNQAEADAYRYGTRPKTGNKPKGQPSTKLSKNRNVSKK